MNKTIEELKKDMSDENLEAVFDVAFENKTDTEIIEKAKAFLTANKDLLSAIRKAIDDPAFQL